MNKFEGYTQLYWSFSSRCLSCFIRMSMNKFEGYTQLGDDDALVEHVVLSRCQWTNLKDIHNSIMLCTKLKEVVLSGCQWTILLQKYKKYMISTNLCENILLFQQKTVPLHQHIWRIYTIRIIPLCKHSGWYASIALFLFFSHIIFSQNPTFFHTPFLAEDIEKISRR